MTDLDRLREEYGPFELREETVTVSRERYEGYVAADERDALGGARVLVHRDDRILLARVRDEFEGWDIVGGKRESGETPEETARREAREEVGVDVTLTDVFGVNRFQFAPEDGTGRVDGLWVMFDGTCERSDLDVQRAELREARWFADPPEALNRYIAGRIREWAER